MNIIKRLSQKTNKQVIHKNHIDSKIKKYVDNYFMEYGDAITVNIKNDIVLRCPTCRKYIDFNTHTRQVYVKTDCVCCFKPVNKTVLLSCNHANICKDCYKHILQVEIEPCFTFINDEPLSTTDEQVRLLIQKYKSLTK